MTMNTPAIKFSMSDDGIGWIVLSRPQVANALDWSAITDLAAAAKEAKKSPARAVFIRGEGKHFCAGADAKWLAAKTTRQEGLKQARFFAETLRALYQMPKPLIALVQGACYGGGIGLAAVANICFAHSSAKFCFGETRLGLIPAVISPYVIAAIGVRSARRYFISGEVMDAQKAAHIGLAHEVIDDLSHGANVLIKQLRQNAPGAMTKAKALSGEVAGRPITSALSAKTAMLLAAANASVEGREGLNAFLQKRKPKWDNNV
ncbi:MAG: enoyl-CoA hydratase-related protein [Gammaproteobacteria bacterium]